MRGGREGEAQIELISEASTTGPGWVGDRVLKIFKMALRKKFETVLKS